METIYLLTKKEARLWVCYPWRKKLKKFWSKNNTITFTHQDMEAALSLFRQYREDMSTEEVEKLRRSQADLLQRFQLLETRDILSIGYFFSTERGRRLLQKTKVHDLAILTS